MNASLDSLDLAIILLYVLATTLLGVWFSSNQKDVKTYFVGDRNVHWGLVLVSIVATETSTVTFLSVPGVAYDPQKGNMTFLQLAIGYMLGRTMIAWFLLPQYFRGECFTAYQLLRQRFNRSVQQVASALFLITRTIADGLRLYLTALLLQQFTGWDMYLSILVMGAVTLLYTYFGGMQAVIWTDLIQFVIYILGAIFACYILMQLLPGGWLQYQQIGEAANKFALFNWNWEPTNPYTFWTGVFGGAFFSMASHGVDQLMVQRYLCSRSLNQARLALITSGVVVFLQFALFLLIGIGLYALKETNVLEVTSTTRNDEVFGIFIVKHLPTGLIGLVIAAVLAAAMSTLSSSLNSSANAAVNDFYMSLRPNQSATHYLVCSKALTLLFGIAQMGVAVGAVWLDSHRSVIDQVLSVAGFTTGIVLGLFLLGSAKQPVSSKAALIGLVVGLAAVVSIWIPSALGSAILAWPWYAPIGAMTTYLVATLVSKLGVRDGSSTDRST